MGYSFPLRLKLGLSASSLSQGCSWWHSTILFLYSSISSNDCFTPSFSIAQGYSSCDATRSKLCYVPSLVTIISSLCVNSRVFSLSLFRLTLFHKMNFKRVLTLGQMLHNIKFSCNNSLLSRVHSLIPHTFSLLPLPFNPPRFTSLSQFHNLLSS